MYYYTEREFNNFCDVEEGLIQALRIVKKRRVTGREEAKKIVLNCLSYLESHIDEVDIENKHLLKNSVILYQGLISDKEEIELSCQYEKKFNEKRMVLEKKINVNKLTNNK